MPPAANAYPLRTLEEHITELEAMVLQCRADPGVRPVHRLRTLTRRVEAQLTLLDTLRTRGRRTEDALDARRILKKLRRAAGEVRDLDVQTGLVSDYAGKSRNRLRGDAEKLLKMLGDRRERAAGKLRKTLEKLDRKLAIELRGMLKNLPGTDSVSLSPKQLTELVREWFKGNAPGIYETTDQLHDLRKRAKLARYLGENAPKNAAEPRRLAAEFESLQKAGGRWHDWLLLSEIAADEVGEGSALTKAFRRRAKLALAAYLRLVVSLTQAKDLPAESLRPAQSLPPKIGAASAPASDAVRASERRQA